MARKLKKKLQKIKQEECKEIGYFRPIFIIIPVLLLILILILLFFVFFNNNVPEVKEGNTTIYVQMYAGPEADAMALTASYWNEHYSNETGIFVRTFPLKSTDYFDKLKVELLSGISSPDIVNPFSFQLEELRPYLEPLNNYLIDEKFIISPTGQRYTLESLTPIALNNINASDGQIYMLPNEVDGLVLYYRKDLISNPPKTWEEFIKVGKNYTRSLNPNSTTRYGISLPAKYEVWTFSSAFEIIWSYGGELFSNDKVHNKNVSQDKNATLRSFEIFEELAKTNITPLNLNNLENLDAVTLLKSNDSAMALDWANIYFNLINNSNLSKDYNKFEVALPPGVEMSDGRINRYVYIQTVNLALNKYSKNKEAAVRFLFWATLGEGAKIYANASSNTAFLSTNRAYQTTNFSNSKIYPWMDQYGRFAPQYLDITDIMLAGSNHIQRIFIQNTTAKNALVDFRSDILNLLDNDRA